MHYFVLKNVELFLGRKGAIDEKIGTEKVGEYKQFSTRSF